jgi:hypothetical protein
MILPHPKPRRAKRVIRLHKLPDYLGNKQTMNDVLIDLGLLHPFSMSPGGRSQVVTEDEVIELQEAAMEAGSLEALVAKARAKQSNEVAE